MKKKLLLTLSYLLTAALASALTLAFFARSTTPRPGKLEELETLILERFIGEADQTIMEDAAADAMVASLGDRWSYYIPASKYATYRERVENAYVGVGITIQRQDEPVGLLVVQVQKNGSAWEAGMRPEDLIIAIDSQSTQNMSSDDAKNLVRGEAGTFVTMQIQRGEEILNLTMERRQIQTQVAAGEMLPGNIGLITISNFDSRCAEESIAAVKELSSQGAAALIFDVRNNPGGYADELVKLLDYLLPEGELFRTVDYRGREQVDTSDADCLDIPMAVLCNENSYSAAEFFAAALQEYEAGTVVGVQTCGKGYFQYTLPLSDGSAVGLSVGKYFTPKGNSLIGTGILPDIEVPVEDEIAAKIYYGTLPHEDDPQLQAAINALQ